jgi:hypothetical protein
MSEIIWITGGKVEVPFTVDEDDFDRFSGEAWHLSRGDMLYAKRRSTKAERAAGHGIRVKLHRLIMNAGPGEFVDHLNADKTDCRKVNLRICTRGQNNMNKGPMQSNNTSGERGVYRKINRWVVKLGLCGRAYHGGSFVAFEDAVRAKRALEAKLYGEFGTARHLGHSSAVA